MSQPSNGITPEIIRGVMPPYHLSPDLLIATIAALPLPPPDTTTTWRQTRLTRLLQEVAALKPADAAQARLAAQLLTTRGLADVFIAHAHTPNLEINQMCRLGRTAAELLRSAATLDRTLARHQQMPALFYGTVIQDEVDIPALETIWASGIPAAPKATATTPKRATPKPATTPDPVDPRPDPRPDPQPTPPPAAPQPATAPDPVDRQPDPQPDPQPTPPPQPEAPRDQSPNPATQPAQPPSPPRTRPAGANWVFEAIDEGPGYTREILRPRTPADPLPEPAE